MRDIALLLIAFGLLSACGSEPSQPAPQALLHSAQQVALEVRTARYTAHFTQKDAPEADRFTLVADVALERLAGDAFGAKVRLTLSDTLSNPFRGGRVAYNGDSLTLLDAAEPRGIREYDSSYLSGNIVGSLVEDTRLIDEDSFSLLVRNAAKLTYDGVETVANVPCHVVTAAFPDDDLFSKSTTRLYIGTADTLLRRVESSAVFDTKLQTWSLTLSDLEVNKDLPAGTFTLAVPEGYSLTRRTGPPPRPKPVAAGAQAPAWTLPDSAGTSVSMADFRGQHVVLDFWGTWCGPCLLAMPHIQDLHERFADQGVAVIGISAREPDWAEPAKLAKRRGFTYPILLHGDAVAEAYQVSGFPTLFVISPDGTVLRHWEGYSAATLAEVETFLEEVVPRSS
jgi:peroxiredoxin